MRGSSKSRPEATNRVESPYKRVQKILETSLKEKIYKNRDYKHRLIKKRKKERKEEKEKKNKNEYQKRFYIISNNKKQANKTNNKKRKKQKQKENCYVAFLRCRKFLMTSNS